MGEPIKIGIVGLGRAGAGFHVPDMLGMPEKYKIVAACDLIASRAEKVKEQCGCRVYASIEELLTDEEVEMVDIATRSVDHYAHACKAIAAGKDAMLEKPVCMNREELADLLTKANGEGQPRVFFRHNRRFEPAFNKMMEIVRSGILGHVFEIQMSEYGYQRRDDWQTISEFGGGQMLNWGPHLIDHALRFLGTPVASLVANNIHAAAGGDCEDHFSIRLTGENGRFITVAVSGSAALQNGRTYTAFGTRGAAVMHNNKIHLRYIDPAQALGPVVSAPGTPGAAFGTTGTYEAAVKPDWVEEDIDVASTHIGGIVLEHIYESYRNGAEYPIKDEEILSLMDVITRAKKFGIVKAENIQ